MTAALHPPVEVEREPATPRLPLRMLVDGVPADKSVRVYYLPCHLFPQ